MLCALLYWGGVGCVVFVANLCLWVVSPSIGVVLSGGVLGVLLAWFEFFLVMSGLSGWFTFNCLAGLFLTVWLVYFYLVLRDAGFTWLVAGQVWACFFFRLAWGVGLKPPTPVFAVWCRLVDR